MAGNLVCLQLVWCLLWTVSNGQTCSNTDQNAEGACHASASSGCIRDPEECGLPGPNRMYFVPEPLEGIIKRCDNVKYMPIPCEAKSSSVEPNLLLQHRINFANVSLHAINSMNFVMNISWNHQSSNSHEGYQLMIKRIDGRYYPTIDCFCIYSREARFLYVDDHNVNRPYMYELNGTNITVEVSLIHDSRSVPMQDVTVTTSEKWPKTCLDIEHNSSTCALSDYFTLPIYDAPSNISVCKRCPSENCSLLIEWEYETDYIDPTIYYIRLSGTNDVHILYVANNTKSVTISDLDGSMEYVVSISAYVYCSGTSHWGHSKSESMLGCGLYSNPKSPELCPSPPVTELLTTSYASSATATTETSPPMATAPSLGANDNVLIIGASAGGGSVVVFVACVLLLVAIILIKHVKPVPESLPVTDFSVFLVHAPHTASERDIQTYVVCRLREYFDVVISSAKERGDVVQWIEERERTSKAVLLVFTREFLSEWNNEEGEKSQVVASVQRLLNSAVSLEHLDKYAIVVLDERSKDSCIPDNHYLKSLNVFTLGKERDEMVELYHFVTRSTVFQHHEGSPPSSIGSSDDKSLCTVSIDINNITPFEDFPDQKLDQPGPQKDAAATVQAGTESVQSEADFQSKHQILQILTEPSDSESLDSTSLP